MKDTLIHVKYRDGSEESYYVCSHNVDKGCLVLCKRFDCTLFIPIDTIKEWRVYD